MIRPPIEARVVLCSGPVAVFLHEDSAAAILQAFDNLRKLVVVATQQFEAESAKCTANPTDPAPPES